MYQELVGIGRNEGLAEGLAEGERSMLLHQGRKRFGEPDARAKAALQAINDRTQLELFGERMLTAASWDEVLFATENESNTSANN